MTTYARDTNPHEPLDAVLRAAIVPGHPEELAGEHAAVTAFRTAALGPRRRSILARVLTVKALVVGAVAASTGVVLATTGVLPVLRPEPVGPSSPADPPAVTSTAPDPARTPPDGSGSTTGRRDAPSTSATPPAPGQRGDDQQGDEKTPPSKPKPTKDDNQDGNGRQDHSRWAPPPSTPPDQGDDDQQQNGGQASRPTQTPVSTAPGAVNAVPPTGAEPPSPGG